MNFVLPLFVEHRQKNSSPLLHFKVTFVSISICCEFQRKRKWKSMKYALLKSAWSRRTQPRKISRVAAKVFSSRFQKSDSLTSAITASSPPSSRKPSKVLENSFLFRSKRRIESERSKEKIRVTWDEAKKFSMLLRIRKRLILYADSFSQT
jgi:hypothetical protein